MAGCSAIFKLVWVEKKVIILDTTEYSRERVDLYLISKDLQKQALFFFRLEAYYAMT